MVVKNEYGFCALLMVEVCVEELVRRVGYVLFVVVGEYIILVRERVSYRRVATSDMDGFGRVN